MNTSQAFKNFLDNIRVDNSDVISNRYKEITKKLNKTFRNTESETSNCLHVGSYGRYTGIKNISDLDMLYIVPSSQWGEYKNDPYKLLKKVKDALTERYPNTDIKVDRLVVDILFKNFTFEVQPVFEYLEDGEIYYKYPDTKSGTFKITKPRQEQDEMTSFRQTYGDTHRHLCKMMRAWKNTMGVVMGGLLIDTLTHNFLSNNSDYNFIGLSKYDELCRDFFSYLKNEPLKSHYQALGSGQDVKVKHPFQKKAEKAYKKLVDAINESDNEKKHHILRDVFGKWFPVPEIIGENKIKSLRYTDREEFIEDKYPINIKYSLQLDCEVSRNGFREAYLSQILKSGQKICRVCSLKFTFKTNAPEPYSVKWKVRNVGIEAIKRDCLRGQIINSNIGYAERRESADFCGPHYMECYIIRNGVVLARERINVPIN